MTLPGGIVDRFTYNGLGLRTGKTDSTGTYAYVCDGAAPGSPVLSDAHALYNPGLSESRAGVVTYSDSDALGNLWTLDAASGDSTPGGCLYTAFGTPVLTSAGLSTPFRYGGASGCQTDADTGLVLMGHRYYDSRTGRFLTQDHAKSGGNWYAYCGNNPVNASDPSGNVPQTVNGGTASINSAGYNAGLTASFEASLDSALTYSEASYEVSKAFVDSRFTAADAQTIKNTLQDILSTSEGQELFAQGYRDEIFIYVQYQTASQVSHVSDGRGNYQFEWPAYTQGAIISISPESLKYVWVYRQDGYQRSTLPDVLVHELGHAMTGIRDTGLASMDNVNANENPVDEALGIWPRLSYDKTFVEPFNNAGVYPGFYPDK